MNYYNPNQYLSYPYGTNPQLSQQPQQNAAAAQLPPQMAPIQQIPNPQQLSALPTLNGKIVDSEDVVKATEVPIGGYGIFPKADLSEIYIKSWNNNGTTSVITFKPIVPQESAPAATEQINVGEFTQTILQKMSVLEEKLDSVLTAQATPMTRKEVVSNGF